MDPERRAVGGEPARCGWLADLDPAVSFAPAGMDAAGDGTALVNGAFDSATACGLAGAALAEPGAGAESGDDGLAGAAAQAPTEMATMRARLARPTRDEDRVSTTTPR